MGRGKAGIGTGRSTISSLTDSGSNLKRLFGCSVTTAWIRSISRGQLCTFVPGIIRTLFREWHGKWTYRGFDFLASDPSCSRLYAQIQKARQDRQLEEEALPTDLEAALIDRFQAKTG